MSQDVTLTYRQNKYTVCLGEAVILEETDEQKAIEAFSQAIKNNVSKKNLSYEEMLEQIKALCLEGVEINEVYKTIQYGYMKYFYQTGKVFWTKNNKMVLLLGGYDYFKAVLSLVSEKQIDCSDRVVELCARVIENNATYSLIESTLNIASAAFSYGNVALDFRTYKMNKGTSSQKTTFDEFEKIVLDTL